jgi:hypothetical protein
MSSRVESSRAWIVGVKRPQQTASSSWVFQSLDLMQVSSISSEMRDEREKIKRIK